MKKIIINAIAFSVVVAASLLQSCADGAMKEYDVPMPEGYQEPSCSNYKTLVNYVDPTSGFMLGAGGIDIAEYKNDIVFRSLVNSNFTMVVPGNAMKYSSIVMTDGSMSFGPMKEFLNDATDNNKQIFGHTLCWHNQQTRKYLESLIAPTPGPAATFQFVNKTVGGDCEAELDAASIDVVNQAVPNVVVGFSEEGGGASGAADDRALKIENPTGLGANFKLALLVKLPAGTFIQSGKRYKISFDVKGSVPANGLYVQVRKEGAAMQQSQEPLIESLGANLPVTVDWTHYEAVLDLPENAKDKNGAGIEGQYYAFAYGFAKFKGTFYFDNISLSVEESVGGGDIEKSPEEKRDILLAEMDRWVKAMMEACDGKVKAWDVVNEPIEDGNNPTGLKTTPQETKDDPAINEFYWQDYLGENYARDVIALARKYGGDDLKLFINDYNLEKYQDGASNLKCETLIRYIEQWESDGATKIDGIATQMHIYYNLDDAEQAELEQSIVSMFELLAATGKLIKISELDMGLRDGETTIYWQSADISNSTHEKMAEFYRFILEKYFEIIPKAQQYGVTHWKPVDPQLGTGWKEGEPVGLWFNDFNRKPTYGGFADGLSLGL